MKDKGLGDTIERFTKATCIKRLADSIPGDAVVITAKNGLIKTSLII